MKCVFLSNAGYLATEGGGVQWCTHDYLETMQAAGFQTVLFPYCNDQRWVSKLRRRLIRRPFQSQIEPGCLERLVTEITNQEIEWVFLNNAEPLALVGRIRKLIRPESKIIYLSHGVESTDQINEVRLAGPQLPVHRRRPKWIGSVFLAELEQRKYLDAVICVSEEDTLFERWLGSKRVCFLPRIIRGNPLRWTPKKGRVGTVSTLSHVPNLEGIRRLASVLDIEKDIRLRLVGSPAYLGEDLAREHPCIDYLGPLDNAAFEAEAATWCAFANPIFCQARGVSTKVAVALGWGLPIVSTRQGCRGYAWDDSLSKRCDSAEEMVVALKHHSELGNGPQAKDMVCRLRALSPTPQQTGQMLRDFLGHL